MSILKSRHPSMPENHPSTTEEHSSSTSLNMHPPPLHSVDTNGASMNGTDEIVYSPHEIDHSLLPFTNTVFFDTNLGRYLDQYEDFSGYEPDRYEGTASEGLNREYLLRFPLRTIVLPIISFCLHSLHESCSMSDSCRRSVACSPDGFYWMHRR